MPLFNFDGQEDDQAAYNLRAIPEKKYRGWGVGGGGETAADIFFLWVVGAERFQIIWVIGVGPHQITWVVGISLRGRGRNNNIICQKKREVNCFIKI